MWKEVYAIILFNTIPFKFYKDGEDDVFEVKDTLIQCNSKKNQLLINGKSGTVNQLRNIIKSYKK